MINAFVLDLLHVEVSRPSRLQIFFATDSRVLFYEVVSLASNINLYKLPMALLRMSCGAGHWQEVQSRNQVTWLPMVTSRAFETKKCWCQGLAKSILLERAAQRTPKRCGCLGTWYFVIEYCLNFLLLVLWCCCWMYILVIDWQIVVL